VGFQAFAAFEAKQELHSHSYEPDPLGPRDAEIEVSHCGVCHTDISLIDDQFFGLSSYPLVPGHEVVGKIVAKGADVSNFEVGDRVGAGWLCGSCGECEACRSGEPNLCPGAQGICAGRPGGFAERVRVDSRFLAAIPAGLESEQAAPLMCAGLTVFTPLDELAVQPGTRIGVVGIGGLGHLALQFAKAFGCEVTALSGSPTKSEEAARLGADHFALTSDAEAVQRLASSFDVLLVTADGDLPWNLYLSLLRPKGTLWLLGMPQQPLVVESILLMLPSRSIKGSIIGSPDQMQRMLEFAAKHAVRAWTEPMPMSDVNTAIDRVRKGEVRYRMVLTAG
jgi:uncharacterized zinc-type alcohol dehydrogenase-like protein